MPTSLTRKPKTPSGRIHRSIEISHLVLALGFFLCAMALLVLALAPLWQGTNPMTDTLLEDRVSEVLGSIAILTVAIAVLELGQTIIEEEVQRATPMSSPTRVRRFLSRFKMVLVVALSIGTLVAVFKFAREDPNQLPGAAALGLVAVVLLAAWGLFIKLNQRVEEMEPEGLEQVRREDDKVAGWRGYSGARRGFSKPNRIQRNPNSLQPIPIDSSTESSRCASPWIV